MGVLLTVALLAQAGAATVSVPAACMYSKPTQEADVVSQAVYGAGVVLLEERDGWVKARTADDYTGWMPLASLRRRGPQEAPYASRGRVAEVASLFANLYREPSVTKRQPLLTVPFETRLEVEAEPESEQRRWIQVRLVDQSPAWVQRGDVVFDPPLASIAETIALAKRFLGLPYLWGGTSTFGYDCSGFTQMLCRRRGVTLPRDAQPQAGWSGVSPVEREHLAPGDLLFFGSSLKKITHTGMYIGGGEFIHATAHGRPVVQISRLDEERWTPLFVAARRLK